ncbi:hypothetical protein J6590_047004 [Homalodisca vitripennis]|nr:hypothetical protein J6590_047004 [Homalodisca vitripennis]
MVEYGSPSDFTQQGSLLVGLYLPVEPITVHSKNRCVTYIWATLWMSKSGTSLTANVDILGCKGNSISLVYWGSSLRGVPSPACFDWFICGLPFFRGDMTLKLVRPLPPNLTHPEYPATPEAALSCLESSPGVVTAQDASPEHKSQGRGSQSHITLAQGTGSPINGPICVWHERSWLGTRCTLTLSSKIHRQRCSQCTFRSITTYGRRGCLVAPFMIVTSGRDELEEDVLARFNDNPFHQYAGRSTRVKFSQSTVWRIVHENLRRLFKIQKVRESTLLISIFVKRFVSGF